MCERVCVCKIEKKVYLFYLFTIGLWTFQTEISTDSHTELGLFYGGAGGQQSQITWQERNGNNCNQTNGTKKRRKQSHMISKI